MENLEGKIVSQLLETWKDELPVPEQPKKNGRQIPLGAKLPAIIAANVEARAKAIPCPDPVLVEAILDVLNTPKVPANIKRRDAGELVINWLVERGEFLQSESGEPYYHYKTERRLYNLHSNLWRAWLYSLTGSNPAGTEFAYFQAECKTAAILATQRPVLRVAAFDKTEMVLRISRFDGTVYRLDGESITEEGNGERVLFDDDSYWKSYTPDYSRPGVFAKIADAYFDTNSDPQKREQYSLALRVWEMTTFFSELCPTRPPLVLVGDKGSGKSMTIRCFLRSLFGSNAELSGVPDKMDGFTAAASAAHILAIDNLDDFHGWMRDKIARLTTGGVDSYRKLYTSNEEGRVSYRCWLAFTARTPDTLRREDLADRLVILPVKRIPDDKFKAERVFLDAAEALRSYWWGDLLTILNKAVARIRAGGLSPKAILRMADWESLGRLVAAIEGKTELWNQFISDLKLSQNEFVLEGDIIAENIIEWIEKKPDKLGIEISSADLYNALMEAFYSIRKPPREWPDNGKKFARRLQDDSWIFIIGARIEVAQR